MSDGSRGSDNPLLGFAVVGFLAIFALIGYGYGVHKTWTEHADQQSKIHHENAEKHITSTCISMKGAAFSECVHDAIQTSGEYQRAEKDLAAQSQMAKWALALLVLSAIGVAITGVGVYWVRETLAETAKAVVGTNKANEIMLEADRPWLTGSGYQSNTYRNSTSPTGFVTDGFVVQSQMTNTGKRPATRVSAYSFSTVLKEGEAVPIFDRASFKDAEHMREAGIVASGTIIASQMCILNDIDTKMFKENKARWIVYTQVEYRDPSFPDIKRESVTCVEVVNLGIMTDSEGRSRPNFGFMPVTRQNYCT